MRGSASIRAGWATRTLASLAIVGALALAMLGAAIGGDGPEDGRLALTAGRSRGLEIVSDGANRAIVSGRDLEPGDHLRGSLKVTNMGGPARISLRVPRFRSPPGPNGGELPERLWLRIAWMREGQHAALYEGTLAELRRAGDVSLGAWGPGTDHRVRFTVRLPRGGRPLGPAQGDNAYQGSRAQVRFVWQAVQAG